MQGHVTVAPADQLQTQLQAFKQAVNAVQHLRIRTISWKNIFNVFLFIPGIINFIKTGGRDFWFKSSKSVDSKKIELLLQKDTNRMRIK